MEENVIDNLKKQHHDNYQRAILEIINNNTCALVDEDIMSLIRKPPLDSMDNLKVKFLDLAKKYKIVLNTDKLDYILDDYRKSVSACCDAIKEYRINELSKIIKKKFNSKDDVLNLYKKDFVVINRKIRNMVKEQLISSLENSIIKNSSLIFQDDVLNEIKKKYIEDYSKYMKGSFQRQFLENFDIKFLVKDTTLINSVKEQSERYLFTLNHSRLLNEVE